MLAAGYQSTGGFAEVRIPGVTADTAVSMPEDLLRAAGTASRSDPLDLVMTRLRSSGYPPNSDTETLLSRAFWLPTPRTFSLTGEARISPVAPDSTIDKDIGRTGVVASTSSRLTGDVQAGADAAIDGDPSTAWQPVFGLAGEHHPWVQYQLPAPITFDSLHLQVMADHEHSVPTSITVAAGGVSEKVYLPAIADSRVAGSVVTVPLTLPTALHGRVVRVTVDGIRSERTDNYYSQVSVGHAHRPRRAGHPRTVQRTPRRPPSRRTCRDDLLDGGRPAGVDLGDGDHGDGPGPGPAVRSRLCGPDAGGTPPRTRQSHPPVDPGPDQWASTSTNWPWPRGPGADRRPSSRRAARGPRPDLGGGTVGAGRATRRRPRCR